MMHHLTGGNWGIIIRRLLEAGATTLPIMALLFIPIVAGMHTLYPWTHSAEIAADEVLQRRHIYLNLPFFLVRLVTYFIIWLGIIYLLNRLSKDQDNTTEPIKLLNIVYRFQAVSGPGLVLFGITMIFATTDWIMSMEKGWSSTVLALIVMVGQALGAFAFTII